MFSDKDCNGPILFSTGIHRPPWKWLTYGYFSQLNSNVKCFDLAATFTFQLKINQSLRYSMKIILSQKNVQIKLPVNELSVYLMFFNWCLVCTTQRKEPDIWLCKGRIRTFSSMISWVSKDSFIFDRFYKLHT